MDNIEPWGEPVDIAAWVNAVDARIARSISMQPWARLLVVVYILFTHCIDAVDTAPYLFVTSPVRKCAKTTLLRMLARICARPEMSRPTVAGIVDAIYSGECTTIFLDGAQHWGDKRGRFLELLEAGHTRDAAAVRKKLGKLSVKMQIFAAFIIAAIGRPLSGEVDERCITIPQQRRRPDEMLERFRSDRSSDLVDFRRMACRWAKDNIEALRAADPEMPEGIDDRAADNFRPLFAIADRAGKGLPERVRRAALQSCADTVEAEDETRIIRDICHAFADHNVGRFRSADLVAELTQMDRRYRHLTPYRLARLLQPFEIHPQPFRFGTATLRGYDREQFEDAVLRYGVTLDEGVTRVARAPATTATTATAVSRNDQYMTILPVAKSSYDTTERLLAADPDMPPLADLWWCEPCGGSGNFVRQMPADRRISFDLAPRDNGEFGIIQADYRAQVLDPTHDWVVLTNSSFGKLPDEKRGGPETCFEWAASQSCVRAIGLIVPHWFQRHTIENRLNPYFHRIHRETLKPESFIRDGQVRYYPAIFDLWVRRPYMRDRLVVRNDHSDWEWLPESRRAEATHLMQNWNMGFGEIKTPDNLGRIQAPDSHWYLKELRPGTAERLRRINWSEVAYPTMTVPRLHKPEVVAAYIAAHGDTDALDYNPDAPRSAIDNEDQPSAEEAVKKIANPPGVIELEPPLGDTSASPSVLTASPSSEPDEDVPSAKPPPKGRGRPPARKPERGDRLVLWGTNRDGGQWDILCVSAGMEPGRDIRTVGGTYYTLFAARKAAKRAAKRYGMPLQDEAVEHDET